MAAVWLVAGSEFRRRWRSWFALAGVVGGLVLAFAAAGRRTASAFPRFVARYGYDSYVYNYRPLSKLTALAEVASAVPIMSPANGAPVCACTHKLTASDFSVYEIPPGSLGHFAKLVAGRWPDQSAPDQVSASFTLEQDFGVHVGSVLRVPFYTSSQAASLAGPSGAPRGPTAALRVVGIEANEGDFPSVGTPSYEVITTRAFAQSVNPRTGVFFAYAVRLRHGPADLARFDEDAMRIGAVGTGGQEAASTVSSAIHPQAMAWWLLAVLAGFAGVAIVAQALSRQARAHRDSYRTLRALGLGQAGLAAIGMMRTVVIAAAGALVAVGLAFVLSPFAPVGEARIAEPSTGFAFDALTFGLGGIAVLVAVMLLGIWPAVRSARVPRKLMASRPRSVRRSWWGCWLPCASPVTVLGVRRALERGRGSSSVPAGTALAGSVIAVAALSATTTFGASLAHLTATPPLYG